MAWRMKVHVQARGGALLRTNAASGGEEARVGRRKAMASSAWAAVALSRPALAIQGMTAGRLPGLSEPDQDGFSMYMRPEGKSGGHGIGWSEIPPYYFKVPSTWEEVPVSIADLGGTELDLRFKSSEDGDLAVVVAPVMRFADIGFNADVRIEDLLSLEQLIYGFGPELTGDTVEPDQIVDMHVDKDPESGLSFYKYELVGSPHMLVSATAFKNRLYIMTVRANGRQWRKSRDKLRTMIDSFGVVPKI